METVINKIKADTSRKINQTMYGIYELAVDAAKIAIAYYAFTLFMG